MHETHIEKSMIQVASESRMMIQGFLDRIKDSYCLEEYGMSQSESVLIEAES